MIISNIKGGLGNQMFQYAYGRSLSLQNNDTIKLDTTSMLSKEQSGNIYRPLSLKLFNIKAADATKEEIFSIKPKQSSFRKILTKIENRLLGDATVCFDKKHLEKMGDQYLDGYWQSPLFFSDIRNVLLQEFTLKDGLSQEGKNIENKILNSNSVSIHIRRGDYASNPRVTREAGLCSVEYYRKAIGSICESVENPIFYVFSDDIEWVRSNLPLDENFIISSKINCSDAEEMILMSKCSHNIIANSSFSWWAAWLNSNEDKIVIAPNPWFDRVKYDSNLISNTWKLIPKY